MASKDERIYLEEQEDGLKRKDLYRIVSAPTLVSLVEKVNKIANQGRWDVISGAFTDGETWYQTMGKMPKEKIGRQSMA